MAAYASLVSLLNNMEHIKNHPHLSISFDRKQMKSLLQRLHFLLDFIESYSNSYGGCSSKEEVEDLEMQIASAVHAAEDVIESHIVDQILAGSIAEGPNFLKKMEFLGKIMEDMDSIKEKVMKVKEERGCKAELPCSSINAAAARKSNMVGFDGYLTQLLVGHQSDRKIISIVGMGGIGKTTLAKNAYDNLLVVHHFDVRAWVTVSQRSNVRGILVETLSCLRLSNDGMDNKTEHDLGEQLYKILSGMRYLIVLDDMWSVQVWDEIKCFFPNNCNRSRILVTTRISDIANHFGSKGLALNFLDDDQSWNLFCDKVFPDEVCPPELEESGKKMVKKCQGLPLAIVVIGGLLVSSSRAQDQWENVEKDVRSILNTVEDNRCFKLLSLSYSHLPACLKPCFLYLRVFPQDEVIRVSRLVKLWVAEGFIKPNNEKSLEEIAEGYIEDLVNRNLISVHSLRGNGKFKACGIHDLVRELCISIAEKEKFVCSTHVLSTPQESQRRIVIHGNTACYPQVLATLKSKSLARSLISKGYLLHVKSRLLRVLIEVYSESIDDTFQQANLRFLAHESRHELLSTYHLPSSISLLWNVQTLIMTGVKEVVVPHEIWKMPQLRHLKFNYLSLPDPPRTPSDGFVLHNLQTLGCVVNFRCTKEACKRMPNIKKLRVFYDDFSRKRKTWSYYCLHNFVFFDKLESLQYNFLLEADRKDLLQSLVFPSSLNKLSLSNCELEWNDLTIVGGSLSHLEVLKLKFFGGKGFSWDPVEGEFLRLRYLKIERCKLSFWNADKTHFPVLENLVLDGIHDLNEIPSGIGDIHTLECIYLVNCSVCVALSAVNILEEQESLGNQGLQVKVVFQHNWDLEKFMEQVDSETLAGLNFQIEGV